METGKMCITQKAIEELSDIDIVSAIDRYSKHDWGDLDKGEQRANDLAIERGEVVVATYRSENGGRFFLVTEADRSATTIMLPSEVI